MHIPSETLNNYILLVVDQLYIKMNIIVHIEGILYNALTRFASID